MAYLYDRKYIGWHGQLFRISQQNKNLLDLMNTPAHNLNDSRIFLTGALQGFPSGGHIVEQILYLEKKKGNDYFLLVELWG